MTIPKHPWTTSDAAAASDAVSGLWAALSEDDDLTALRLTATDIHEQHGPYAGFCGRMRRSLAVNAEVCARVGISSKVRIVDGRMIFVCMDVGPEKRPVLLGHLGVEDISGWSLWTALERGTWVVGGSYSQPDDGWPPGTEYLDLPHALIESGPIN